MNRSVVVMDGSPATPITASAVLRDDHAQLDHLVLTLSNIQHSSEESLHISQPTVGSLRVVSISTVTACYMDSSLLCMPLDAVVWVTYQL